MPATSSSGKSMAVMLRAFVERVERVNDKERTLSSEKRDIYAEARTIGVNVKALKQLIRRRREDPAKLRELDEVCAAYLVAIGEDIAEINVSADELQGRSDFPSEMLDGLPESVSANLNQP